MSFLINDNSCECGHPRANHVHDNKLTPQWCALNQKACDCWQYKAREVERREYVDLQIIRGY
jgi:hypothetical protein